MIESKDKDKLVIDVIDISSSELIETKPINNKMDHWYLDLRKNFTNEFDKLRLQFHEEAQQNILHEKQIQIKEYIHLNQAIKTMREMLNHYEHTINQKSQTEKNLNKALDLLYNKTIAYHRCYERCVVCIEKRREKYSLSLAKHFYEEKMKRRALAKWKNVIEHEWKKRFELVYEYKLKCKQLEFELLNANKEIKRLKFDKNESLKKSFMRSVCALNMEAMSVLLKNEQR